MSEPSDEELMEAVQDGSRSACEMLIERHMPDLYRFAWRMLGNHSEAEDAVQETFLRLWDRAGKWKAGGARFSTWLHTITRNICIDQTRRARTRRQVPLDEAPPLADTGGGSQPEREQEARQVLDALQALPERQRIAILLCHYEGLSNIEAAAALEVSVDALESLMARGRRTLRSILEEE